MGKLFVFVFRAFVAAAALVFTLGLAVAVSVALVVWLLRAGWARLTGGRVAPFAVKVDARRRFERAMRSRAGDVVDVEARVR